MKKIIWLFLLLIFIFGFFHFQKNEDKKLFKTERKITKKIERVENKEDKKIPQKFNFKEIKNYRVIKKSFIWKNKKYFALREFDYKKEKYIYAFDLENFKGNIFLEEKINFLPDNSIFKESNYFKILSLFKNKHGYQNIGLKSGFENNKKVYLSADFCPSSKKGFEKEFIQNFIKNGNKNIAIAFTGKWIEKHPQSFNWLLEKNKKGELGILWVNHSYNHRYKPGFDIKHNFLLLEGTDFEKEILENEKIILSYGEKFSPFFRFPGLVSDEKLRKKLIEKYSLIPLAANAWLAKGEKPKNESIILVHANKNEHRGIVLGEKFLEKAKKKKIKFSDLRDILKERIKTKTSKIDVEKISEKFLNKKYKANTLTKAGEKERLIFDFNNFDCFTYIDTVEALKRSEKNKTKFEDELRKIRYKNGVVSYFDRNHYFTDWVENNGFKNVSRIIAGDKVKKIFKKLNLKNEKKVLNSYDRGKREIEYILTKDLNSEMMKKIKTGDYIGWYSDKSWLDVSHVGLAVWKNDTLYFRHASSLKGRVVDTLFRDIASRYKAFLVLRE